MRKLILIKHSAPHIDPSIPAREWHLSEQGRRRAALLAQRIAPYAPGYLAASMEPKAMETAAIVAGMLGTAWSGVEGLHEQDRREAGFLAGGEFEAAIERLFAYPDEIVLAPETAEQAYRRFDDAVWQAIRAHAEQNVAIVAHGTVIALFVSRATGLDPFTLWKRLGLPAFVVLSLPDLEVLEIVQVMET